MSNALSKYGSLIIGLLGIVGAIYGAVLAALDHTAQAALLMGSGLLFFFAGTIDRFAEIRGLGISAKLKEKIDEADRVLAQVRMLAEVTGAQLLLLTASNGRIGGPVSIGNRHDLATKIRVILASAGSSAEVVQPHLVSLARTMIHDLVTDMLGPINQQQHLAYNAMATRASEVVSQHGQSGEKHLALAERMRRHWEAWQYLQLHGQWALGDYPRNLRAGIEALVEVGAPYRNEAIADLDAWTEELKHLIEKLELKTPHRWISRLDKV